MRLVPFLFGVARRDELAGTALVELLGVLGLSRSAARGLIARMRRDGQLASEPAARGPGRQYRMAGPFAEAFHRIRTGAAGQPAVWDGIFHALLYQVPETERGFRDRLRRHALFAGYGLLQPGVMICPTDRREPVLAGVTEPPAGAVVTFARLELDPADTARAAVEAWNLDELDAIYRAHAATLRSAVNSLSAQPPAGAETLRFFTTILNPALVDLLRTPALPVELFPPGWAVPDLWAAVGEVQRVFGPPSAAFVEEVLGPV